MPTIQEMIETSKQKLGAIGGIVGDFARGVGATASIPNTIVTGTQNSYGANIPTVEDTRQKLVASTPPATELIKDTATGVSRVFNNINTPTANFGAIPTPPPAAVKPSSVDKAVVRPEGDPNFFKGGATFQPSTGLGASTDSGLAEWQAERDRQNSIINGKNPEYLALEKERSNPNNALFKEIVDKVKDINTFMSGDPLTRKYQTQQLGALNHTLNALAPLTSYGHFGVAGIEDETKKRGQDITADTTKRGQDIDKEIKAPYYGANAKESEAKSKLYGTHAKILEEEGKPDKVREKEVSGWLTERQKVINASLGDLEGLSDEEKTTKMNARIADFNKYNPPPIKSAKKNTDGTVTVQYADGTVKTGKPVK